MITYGSICEKLGWCFLEEEDPNMPTEWTEDYPYDPLSVLTQEEKDFLLEYALDHVHKHGYGINTLSD